MKDEVKQAFEMMSRGECPCHKQIQSMGPRLEVKSRRGYADPRWPDVPIEYAALVRNIKNRPALFAYKRRLDGSWDVDPIVKSERAEKVRSGHQIVEIPAGQVLGVDKVTLEARLFG